MSPQKYRALLRWMVGLILSVLCAGMILAYVSRQATGEALAAGSLLSWVIPLGVLFIIVSISWFLLSRDRVEPEAEGAYVACPACGKAILRDWRMCPYCGERAARAGSD